MKKISMLTFLTAVLLLTAAAQEIPIDKGWKFSTGDSAQWASPAYNDQKLETDRYHQKLGGAGLSKLRWLRLVPLAYRNSIILKRKIIS